MINMCWYWSSDWGECSFVITLLQPVTRVWEEDEACELIIVCGLKLDVDYDVCLWLFLFADVYLCLTSCRIISAGGRPVWEHASTSQQASSLDSATSGSRGRSVWTLELCGTVDTPRVVSRDARCWFDVTFAEWEISSVSNIKRLHADEISTLQSNHSPQPDPNPNKHIIKPTTDLCFVTRWWFNHVVVGCTFVVCRRCDLKISVDFSIKRPVNCSSRQTSKLLQDPSGENRAEMSNDVFRWLGRSDSTEFLHCSVV